MTTDTKTAALLGRKLGMTQVWDENGKVVPLTVVQVGKNVVTQVRTEENDGYNAVQIGFEDIDPRRVTKPLLGHFEKAGVAPKRHLAEFRTKGATEFALGSELAADTFEVGAKVDVSGNTKGKGFAGVMKRHGFAGGPASHGAHKIHRKPGSIGACSTPGRIFKGQRMAGRMGGDKRTVQNLTIQGVDTDRGLLLIKGAIPGPRKAVVMVRTAAKGA
ncbi:50S ribosomal protein L3 [Actinomyces minihominis]|uniref:50S ribosomal protein L3 n=1 Tax=Actinomyces minihominis TaxID=2002838 RepID=UPI000C07D3C2|nr:50S ribosomal protein L3 [Actinomyces minihominis]